MKCPHCGSLNKDGAKFCKNCGEHINNKSLAFHDKFGSKKVNNKSYNKNTLIICITIIVCTLIVAGAFVYLNSNNNRTTNVDDVNSINTPNSNNTANFPDSQQSESGNTEHVKSWNLVDTLTGSGTGSESYILPTGKIKVEITAFPINNYASNYLITTSSTGDTVSVDWDSYSAVESKSNSMTFTSTGGDTLSIDYLETMNWQVKIYQYS